MLLKAVTVAVLCNLAYSAVQGTVKSTATNYCGETISGSVDNGYANAHVWVFQTYSSRVDVTFSTCNSPVDFQDGLRLYDYKLNAAQSTEIAGCYHNTGTGCETCGLTSLTDWTVFGLGGDYEIFYIEIYSLSSGTHLYDIHISCINVPSPTTTSPTTTAPTIFQPTTAIPTTALPTTSNPTTSEPTTSNPTTQTPTAIPTTSTPTTYQPTTAAPTTASPTTITPTTNTPTTNRPTTKIPTSPNLVDIPTEPPTTAADGEAKNTIGNTLETGDAKTDNTKYGMDMVTILLIIIIALVVIILCGALGCYTCFLKKKKAAVVKENAANDIEIAQIVPNDGCKTGTGTGTEIGTGTDSNTNNGNNIMRVGSVSLSGERENIMITDMGINKDDDTDTDSDNEMYDKDKMNPNINESPGSFEITPGSTSKPTSGGMGVDFMDINENENNMSNGSICSDEGDIDILNEDENMDEMYDKENKYKTSGKDDEMYKKSEQITKS